MVRAGLIGCALCLIGATTAAHATNLWQVWQLAKANDPAFQQAVATRKASMEAKPQAWAKLIPSIDLTAGRTYVNSTNHSYQFFGSGGSIPVTSASNTAANQWSAQLTETLFNWGDIKNLQSANLSVAKAEADYQSTKQQLIVTVAQAYFGVLNARDILNANVANEKALARQLDQARQQYKVGLVAITGVKQAEAAYDTAKANVISARQSLLQAQEALRAITNEFLPKLAAPQKDLPLKSPSPNTPKAWVQRAFQDNPNLISARLAARIANKQISIARSGHYPSVDLVLSRTYNKTTGNNSYEIPNVSSSQSPAFRQGYDNQIALQLSWPIFSGGATLSQTRQAQDQADAAQAQAVSTLRSTEQQVRNAYLGVLSGIARVRATRQSVASSRVSLQATEAGLKVGTQTMVDVLTARQNLLTAQENFYQARYNYLVQILLLKQAAGILSPKDIKQINGWLTASAQPNASPSTTAMSPATMGGPTAANQDK